MKILTLVGTRPELIRLSVLINKLDIISNIEHIFVYTNQNYDAGLRDIFMEDLGLRKPDYVFKEVGYKDFLANAIREFSDILLKEKPDKVLILGDTNSGLLSIIANKHRIPVYHMEAGNRSYDDSLPEETNRRVIDAVSKYNLPYTENSKDNLLREGYQRNYVIKIGNPIYEVLEFYKDKIQVKKDSHVLVSFHRTNNVDYYDKVNNVLAALKEISIQMPVILSLHPRTKDQLKQHNIEIDSNITVLERVGFFEFIALEKSAHCVITDSGTVPEECAIFHVPCIVTRDFIERQELIDNGSVIVCGTNTDDILRAYNVMRNSSRRWVDIPDYFKINVSDTVINILMGYVQR